MTATVFHVPQNGSLEFERNPEFSAAVRREPAIVICEGVGSLTLPAGVAAVWGVTRGRLAVSSVDAQFTLRPNDLYICDSERITTATTVRAGRWFAIVATSAVWTSLLRTQELIRIPGPALFPRFFPSVPATLQQFDFYVGGCERAAARGEGNVLHHALLSGALDELQGPVEAYVARCPGKSLARRRQVFLRLQRVRNVLMARTGEQLDLNHLAELANYSRWRLIRAFDLVFGETPYAFSLRCRTEHAKNLMSSSEMTISEIARASGFEHRSAFCRAFKHHFGVTATEARNNLLRHSDARRPFETREVELHT